MLPLEDKRRKKGILSKTQGLEKKRKEKENRWKWKEILHNR